MALFSSIQNMFAKAATPQAQAPQGILGAQMQQAKAPSTTGNVAQTFAPQAPQTAQAAAQGYRASQTETNPFTTNVLSGTATAQGYNAATRAADQWGVDQKQTVQGQTMGLLAEGNPLLEKAMADSRLDAASRGLLNSSMAAGAGRAAVLDKALQIAAPDAQTYANAAQFNATAKNQAGSENMSAVNQSRMFGADAKNTASQFNAGQANAFQDAQLGRLLSASQANTQARNAAQEFGAGATNAASQFNAGQTNSMREAQAGRQFEASSQNAQARNAAEQFSAGLQAQTSQFNASQAAQAALTQYDAAFKASLANADAANKVKLTEMDGQIKQTLAGIEAQFKNQMQTSSSAATMYSQAMQSLAAIMTDKDLDDLAKQNMINQTMGALQGGLKLQADIGGIQGLDFLLNQMGAGSVKVTNPTPPPTNPDKSPFPVGGRATWQNEMGG